MELGLTIFPTDQTMEPVELGRLAEEMGFTSLWFPEHSHIPVSRDSPWGGRTGAPPLPEFYWRTYDQFVALAAVAATTSKIRVGTGICLLAQRDPIWTAKEVASIDRLSGGRFTFGVGYGWNVEEMEDHGWSFSTRRDRLRESVMLMKELWSNDVGSYEGAEVSVSPSWAWPKPTQQPHPPIVMGGGAGPKTAAHIAEFCNGWMPIGSRHAIESGWAEVVKACEAIDRDPATIRLGVFGARPDAEQLDALAEQGVVEAVISLPQGPRDEVLRALEDMAPLLSR